jgi:plastocyanin
VAGLSLRLGRRGFAARVAAGVLLLAAVLPLRAEEIRGRIELLGRGGLPARGADVREAVVSFEPAGGGGGGTRARSREAREPALLYVMTTRDKEFLPRVLPIPVGGRVQFANDDPILHNVFSVSNGKPFDLGFLRKGPGRERQFDTAGLVRIYCNVHHSMVGYVLVLDTPYFTQPAADGSFVLANLPKGAGRLTVWHEQTDPWTTAVSLAAGAAPPVTARIEITHPQVPSHLDKNGKSYFTSGRDQYRH